MPLLGGLFSRKNKAKNHAQTSSVASSTAHESDQVDSNLSSPTASYVTPDKYIPSSPNGRSHLHPNSAGDAQTNNSYIDPITSSSNKLRLPFGRKKTTLGSEPVETDISPPRPAYAGRLSSSSTVSDADSRRLKPPPSKSAIFAAYGDPHSALSTRSLPIKYPTHSESPTPLPPLHIKRPSLFSWAKSSGHPSFSKNVSPTTDKSSLSPTTPTAQAGDSSFNLKSFRHIRPSSPTRSNGSNVSLALPNGRPRGESVQSESSQRISVAAFREAQARRSLAGSPSPSFRTPSPLPNSPPIPAELPRGRNSPRPSASSPHINTVSQQQRRKSGMSLAKSTYTSDSDEAQSSSEEEDSDDDTQRGLNKRVNGTLSPLAQRDRMGKARAKSEMGHGSTVYTTPLKSDDYTQPSKSHLGHGVPPVPTKSKQTSGDKLELPPHSQSSLNQYGVLRPRASNSTSALAPSAAAKRASQIAVANGTDALSEYKRSSRHIRDSSIHSNPGAPPTIGKAATHLGHGREYSSDSDSDSEDNAPLASLLNPRRPGSATSGYSNGYAPSTGNISAKSGVNYGPHKPLIDIKELTGGLTVANRSGTVTLASTLKISEGFTQGHTLLSDLKSPSTPRKPSVESPPPMANLSHEVVSKTPPMKFVSPPGSLSSATGRNLMVPPPRSATMPLPSKETSPERERKRDALTERLSKAVKKTVGSTLSAESSPSPVPVSPNPSPSVVFTRETSPTSHILGRGRATSPTPASPLSFADRQIASPRSIDGHEPEPPTQQRQGQRKMSVTTDVPASPSVATVKPAAAISEPSSPDLSLADLLGAGIKLISRTGEYSSSESDSTDSDDDSEDAYNDTASLPGEKESAKEKEPDRIAPIPIKQRAPQPSFSVTSRPQFPQRLDLQSSDRNSNGSVPSGSTSAELLPSTSATSSPFTATGRKRSSTLIPSPTSSSTLGGFTQSYGSNGGLSPNNLKDSATPSFNGTGTNPYGSQANADRANALRAVGATIAMNTPRQRSSTMLPMMPVSQQPPSKPSNMLSKPFAVRRDSPASSTGDSSSGRAPLTPRDGSDIGRRNKRNNKVEDEYSGGASGLGIGGKGNQTKRRSVSFEDDVKDLPDQRTIKTGRELVTRNAVDNSAVVRRNNENQREERRRDRRREEAKAAIELGNVINGRGPIVEDDDEMPVNQAMNSRMSTMNPMMNMGPVPMSQMSFGGQQSTLSPGTWGPVGMNMNMNLNMTMQQQAGNPGMLSPAQFMLPPPADPNFFAAHQHAMMIAKQAYQMAVAQQAMAAAGDEWERSSNVGGFGGSVYGGSTIPSSMMTSPYGMVGGMGMGGMNNMSMIGGGNNWSTGSAIFPPNASRSMYGGGGFSSSRSEYGGMLGDSRGVGDSRNWSSSKSSYGESFGPSADRYTSKDGRGRSSARQRDSGYFPPVPPIPTSSGTSNPRSRTTSQPGSPSRSNGNPRKAMPPSSWKAGI